MNEALPEEHAGRRIEHPLVTWLGAVLLFCVCLVQVYSGFLPADWSRAAPRPIQGPPGAEALIPALPALALADYRLAVWSVARNARTLARDPLALFDAEPCHPAPRALALHHPVISPALLALPFWIATGDPLRTFNLTLLAGSLVSALAMLLLVRDWTGSTAAGLGAAALYAFHVSQLDKPQHFFNTEDAWWLLALYFGRRLLATGRWRDVAGFVVCCLLQVSASFYPLLAALVLALPLGAHLLWQQGRPAAPARLVAALALTAVGAALLLSPYAALSGESLGARANVFYAPWDRFAPGGSLFPGWVCLGLLLAGLALPRARVAARLGADPRPALLFGALLVAWIATGGNVMARIEAIGGEGAPPALPNLFAWMRRFLPGAASVRLPSALGPVVVEIAAILAGLGIAGLLACVPARLRTTLGTVLVVLALVDTLRPAVLGLEPPVRFSGVVLRPDPALLEFYADLHSRGVGGPFFEIPIDRRDKGYSVGRASLEQLLSAYHGQRTSGCYVSFVPASVRALGEVGPLDQAEARARLRALGFETIIVHHPGGSARRRHLATLVARQAARSQGELVPIAATADLSAYALRAPGTGAP